VSSTPSPYRYLFGPVPSRRFGRSLGVDLLQEKTCTYNCVYCQLGPTALRTTERREWVPTHAVIAEIGRWADENVQQGSQSQAVDVITVAGSGEPTLHAGLGKVLDAVRKRILIPSALLTNGSLLHLAEVREDAAKADIVKVTLSAPNRASWREIHRPAPHLSFEQTIEGMKKFREEFRGELWIEVMMMEGLNALESDAREIAALAAPIRPDRIQLNTPVRPPAEPFVRPVEKGHLDELASMFHPTAEVIGEYQGRKIRGRDLAEHDIVALVRRHPCSEEDVAAAFGLRREEVARRLESLLGARLVCCHTRGDRTFYSAPLTSGEEQ